MQKICPNKYPIFVISYNRAKNHTTSKILAEYCVPHYLVLHKEQIEEYKKYFNKQQSKYTTILEFDDSYKLKYETCDSIPHQIKNAGSGAERNFAWDYSIKLGAKAHWLMDDNILSFRYVVGICKRNNTYVRKKATDHYWLFRCDCGKEKILLKSSVTSGHIKSCGCYHKEKTSIIHKKHGLANSRIYGIWCHIKARCKNPKHIRHDYYYDKGINICDEWINNFENFYNWAINNGYDDNLTIDRIDVNGNYEPINCRWVNNKIQSNNKTNNHNITVNGITHTISEWCDIKRMNYHTFYSRLNRGWNIEKILNTQIRGKKC